MPRRLAMFFGYVSWTLKDIGPSDSIIFVLFLSSFLFPSFFCISFIHSFFFPCVCIPFWLSLFEFNFGSYRRDVTQILYTAKMEYLFFYNFPMNLSFLLCISIVTNLWYTLHMFVMWRVQLWRHRLTIQKTNGQSFCHVQLQNRDVRNARCS